ncbi:hypothetical protein DFH09DRAFT_1076018 [Mycena vulgaris]|nr:hypothetical protein DFH09DRAFT_1076018 [Mycena vulgaris]
MFNKGTLLFFALLASSVLAAPVPDFSDDDSDAPTSCNKDFITTNLADMLQMVTDIPSKTLATDQDGTTFAIVRTALNAANAANTAGDFATVASSLQTVVLSATAYPATLGSRPSGQ